ncbi:hypothetical protein AAY473_025870 [Plecturocebus cupreus]
MVKPSLYHKYKNQPEGGKRCGPLPIHPQESLSTSGSAERIHAAPPSEFLLLFCLIPNHIISTHVQKAISQLQLASLSLGLTRASSPSERKQSSKQVDIPVPSEFFPAGCPHCTEIANQHQGQLSMVGNQKAMLEHALAKVMNLGLNCRKESSSSLLEMTVSPLGLKSKQLILSEFSRNTLATRELRSTW